MPTTASDSHFDVVVPSSQLSTPRSRRANHETSTEFSAGRPVAEATTGEIPNQAAKSGKKKTLLVVISIIALLLVAGIVTGIVLATRDDDGGSSNSVATSPNDVSASGEDIGEPTTAPEEPVAPVAAPAVAPVVAPAVAPIADAPVIAPAPAPAMAPVPIAEAPAPAPMNFPPPPPPPIDPSTLTDVELMTQTRPATMVAGKYPVCLQSNAPETFGPTPRASKDCGITVNPDGTVILGEYFGGFDGFYSFKPSDGHEDCFNQAAAEMLGEMICKTTVINTQLADGTTEKEVECQEPTDGTTCVCVGQAIEGQKNNWPGNSGTRDLLWTSLNMAKQAGILNLDPDNSTDREMAGDVRLSNAAIVQSAIEELIRVGVCSEDGSVTIAE